MTLRYNDDTEMVMFFLNHDRHNPAVTQSGVLISVGTAPVQVHGKISDTRVRNPLHGRRDFDLNHPDSLDHIEEYLWKMMDKCEPRGLDAAVLDKKTTLRRGTLPSACMG